MTKEKFKVLGVFKSGPIDYQEELYSEKSKVYKIRVVFQVELSYYEVYFHSYPIRKYVHKLTLNNLKGIHHINKYENYLNISKSTESKIQDLDFTKNLNWYIEEGLHGSKAHQLFREFGELLRT